MRVLRRVAARLLSVLTAAALAAAPLLLMAQSPAAAGYPGTPGFNDTSPTPLGQEQWNAVAAVGTDVWIAGNDGSIMKSTDGGTTWSLQQTPTLDDLASISFASASDGVAAGGGSLLETTDGGQTWTALTIAGKQAQAFSHVSAVEDGGNLDIFATGQLGSNYYAYVSQDGGQTWSVSQPGSVSNPYTGLSAVETGSGPVAWVTTKTSHTAYKWTAASGWTLDSTVPVTGTLQGLAFANGSDGVAVDVQAYSQVNFRMTTDGGSTWSDMSPSILNAYGRPVAAMVNGKPNYWVLALNSSDQYILEHFDGSSWSNPSTATSLPMNYAPYNNFSLQPQTAGVASGSYVVVGAGGYIATSPNTTTSWTQVTPQPAYGFYGVSGVPGTSDFVAVGGMSGTGDGVIYRSTDDGQSWSQVGTMVEYTGYTGVSFASSTDGAVVGNTGGVPSAPGRINGVPPAPAPYVGVSTNGGQSFTTVTTLPTLSPSTYLSGVSTQMKNGQLEIWAVGGMVNTNGQQVGLILFSPNGGQTWTQYPTATLNAVEFTGVSFASPQVGWAVGQGNVSQPPPFTSLGGGPGVIYYTDDGGQTWTQQDAGDNTLSSLTLFGVSAPDTQHVFAVAGNATIFSSSDGGQSWSNGQLSPITNPHHPYPALYGVDFTDSQHGTVVGNYGVLLTTSDGGTKWNGTTFTGSKSILDAVATQGAASVVGGQMDGLLLATPVAGGPGGPQVPCDPVAHPEIIGPPGGVMATPDCLYTEPLAHNALGVNQHLRVQEIPTTFLPALPKGLVLADPIFHVTGVDLSSHQIAYVKYDPKVLQGRQDERLSLFKLTPNGWMYVPTNVDLKNNPYPGTVAIYNQGPATYALLENPQVFPDVQAGTANSAIIDQLLASTATEGFLNGKFEEQATINRAQFLKMLMVVSHHVRGVGTGGFLDVDAGTWYAPWVAGGVAQDVAQPLDPLHFGPFQPIKRQTEAQWMAAALDLQPPKNPPAIADEGTISPGARTAVYAVVAAGYMKTTNGMFDPQGTMTRLAAAKMLAQVIDNQSP